MSKYFLSIPFVIRDAVPASMLGAKLFLSHRKRLFNQNQSSLMMCMLPEGVEHEKLCFPTPDPDLGIEEEEGEVCGDRDVEA